MDSTLVASFAGYSITVGTIASLTTQYVKRYFPLELRKVLCRLFVGLICVGLNVGIALYTGEPVGLETAALAFFSYITAAAEYDHLFT